MPKERAFLNTVPLFAKEERYFIEQVDDKVHGCP